MDKTRIKVGSDFSGIGAFNEALKRNNISFEETFACDYDEYARKTFIILNGTEADLELVNSKEHSKHCKNVKNIIFYDYSNFKDPYVLESLKIKHTEVLNEANEFAKKFSFYYPFNVYDREIPEESLDIYMTSPPCQAFSLAGKRLGKDDIRGILFFNSLEFIQKNQPRYFMFENVKGLLSDDKVDKKAEFGRTFQEWINYLGGKSVNGVHTFFPYEDSVPYHIYFQVLNAKEYGVPQNRERIFIIGIRDDEDDTFIFPKTFPLEKRLKDVLEPIVDDKYFLSEKTLEYFDRHLELHKEKGNGFGFKPKELTDESANSITTKYGSRQSDTFLKIGTWRTHEDGKGFRETEDNCCPTIPARAREDGSGQPVIKILEQVEDKNIINPLKGKTDMGWHFEQNVYSEESILRTLKSSEGSGNKPKVILNSEPLAGAIRGRNEENPKSRKKGIELTQIFEKNEDPSISNTITTVNKDNVLLVPSATKLGFEKAEEEEDSINLQQLDSETRRGRVGKKVVQTLDTSCNQGIYTQQRIRRLTPKECLRLMDFSEASIDKILDYNVNNPKKAVSDSQLYKQAGNSIVVKKIELLTQKLNLKIK